MAKVNRRRVVEPTGEKSETQQHFKDAQDINLMLRPYLPGEVPQSNPSGRQPRFISLTGDSFHEMLIKVQEAQDEFNQLPARLRRRFHNNPEMLIRFCENPDNLPELVKAGIVHRDDLSDEHLAQLDLVEESERTQREEFEAWKKSKATSVAKPPEKGDGG